MRQILNALPGTATGVDFDCSLLQKVWVCVYL